jgi:hypothetical protein
MALVASHKRGQQLEAMSRVFKIPNSKHQTPNNLQLPNVKCPKRAVQVMPVSFLHFII